MKTDILDHWHFAKKKHYLLPLLSFFLLVSSAYLLFGPPVHAQSVSTVTFGAVGDSGGSTNAAAVYTTVKNANLDFFLQVGDFSYDQQGGPTGWPTWVKGIVGSVLPFEIVSGNHDDCCISSYVAGFPNKMANLNGDYGKNYYYDYPQTSPLMRVIMISPGGFAPNTTWLTSAIDTARSANIPWVIVGMHRNCITTGQKSCEIGASTMTLLLNKKVDLILQGHDHNYQRSKQLSCVTTNTTNQACIVNNGPTYTKGAGSVVVIDGAGGNGFYGVNAADSEAGYFAAINSDTYGYTKYTVNASQIAGQFIRAAGGNFADSFAIVTSGTNPNPTTPPIVPPTTKPAATPTKIPATPTASPIATLLRFTVDMHGIGNSGDNTNPTGGQYSNKSPIHPQRTLTLTIYDTQNQLVMTKILTAVFNVTSNTYEASTDLGSTFSTGDYTIKLKDETHLTKLMPGITHIQAQKTTTLPLIAFTAGDANGDNVLNIADYNLVLGCYSDLLPAAACDSTKKVLTDLNDDGAVNQIDYNLFLREISAQSGN